LGKPELDQEKLNPNNREKFTYRAGMPRWWMRAINRKAKTKYLFWRPIYKFSQANGFLAPIMAGSTNPNYPRLHILRRRRSYLKN
jgi:hypothetical protein